ncbi:cell division protein FtsQ [Parapusillimonas sp. JC17]|uniref:cell division protein FtsQ n=1 Tax=Parapusillimonas sp. JC17 TaxID=3445768 RepID=UPI003FA018E4
MNRFRLSGILGLLWLGLGGCAYAVDLYPTGPTEDAAFVRFVNAGLEKLDISAKGSGASVELRAPNMATSFLPVTAGRDITGKLVSAGFDQDIALKASAGEFITVVASAGQEPPFSLSILREQPEDFTAVKASVAFYNMNARCASASVQVAGRKVFLFESIAQDTASRRLVNPVKLAVELVCDGAAVGSPLDMGRLEAGARYSIFLAPGDPAARFFFVMDEVANQ